MNPRSTAYIPIEQIKTVTWHSFPITVNFRFKHVRSKDFFDLRNNFTVPKSLVHKMFDLGKISRTPSFDLRKKNQAFWGKKGNFWQKMLKLRLLFFLITKNNMKELYIASYMDCWASYLTINNIWKCSFYTVNWVIKVNIVLSICIF